MSSSSSHSSSTTAPMVSSASVPSINFSDSFRYFLAGNIAGMAGVITGQPFDTVKVRLQTQHQLYESAQSQLSRLPSSHHHTVYIPPLHRSFSSCCIATIREGGFFSLYRGMSSPIVAVGVQKSIAFGVYGTVAQLLRQWNHHLSENAQPLYEIWIASMAGGMANSLILTPVDQLKIAMQIQRYDHSNHSLRKTASDLIRTHGFWRGMYGNFSAVLCREIPMYSTYYTTYVWLNRKFNYLIQDNNSDNNNGKSNNNNFPLLFKLCTGGLTGLICWSSCYPLDSIKSAMQAQTAKQIPYSDQLSIGKMMKKIYRTEGIRGFYRGSEAAIIRAFPVHAVVLSTYDLLMKYMQTK